MSDFTNVLLQTLELSRLSITDLKKQILPIDYSEKKASGQVNLQTSFYQLGLWGEMRAVLIQAPKINIINIFFFPHPHWDLPVYAMEFVVLGHKPIVAVIDAFSLFPQAVSVSAISINNILKQAHKDFQHLKQASDLPSWYQECRSGQDFFVRPQNEHELLQLTHAHLQIWKALMNLLPQAQDSKLQQASINAKHANALKLYKHHHRDNTPGLKLLQQKFGQQWTQEFLRDYLFA